MRITILSIRLFCIVQPSICKRNENDKLVTHYRGTWPFLLYTIRGNREIRNCIAKRIDQQHINHSIYSAINKTSNNLLLASSLRNEHIRRKRKTNKQKYSGSLSLTISLEIQQDNLCTIEVLERLIFV